MNTPRRSCSLLALFALGCSGGYGSDVPPSESAVEAGVAPPASDAGASSCATLAPGDTPFSASGRTWTVHVPPNAASPAALVVLLHGGGGTAAGFENNAQMNAKADAEGFLVAHPDGSADASGKEFWNSGPTCGIATEQGVDDIAFLRAMIADVSTHACVDPKRVFVAGFSEGAALAHRVGCQMSDVVAAIAPVSSGLTDFDPTAPPAYDFTCAPTQPVSVFAIHGTKDCANPFMGGRGEGCKYTNPSIPDTMKRWSGFDRCGATSTSLLHESHAEGALDCARMDGCPTGVDVELCALENGTHGWPGPSAPAGPCPNAVAWKSWSATDAIWSFFAAHPRH